MSHVEKNKQKKIEKENGEEQTTVDEDEQAFRVL